MVDGPAVNILGILQQADVPISLVLYLCICELICVSLCRGTSHPRGSGSVIEEDRGENSSEYLSHRNKLK